MKIAQRNTAELNFLLAYVITAVGIRLQVNAGLGLSMVAAPAYILSVKIPWLTQGMAEWIIQGVVFLAMCLMLGKFRWRMIWSFVSALPYGLIFDGVSLLLADVKAESMAGRLLLCMIGCVFLSMGIALFFKSYLPCQVHEMFVKAVAKDRNWNQGKVKSVYDATLLCVSVALSLLFFGRLEGVGIGTVICTLVNGPLISLWLKLMEGRIGETAAFPALEEYFGDL